MGAEKVDNPIINAISTAWKNDDKNEIDAGEIKDIETQWDAASPEIREEALRWLKETCPKTINTQSKCTGIGSLLAVYDRLKNPGKPLEKSGPAVAERVRLPIEEWRNDAYQREISQVMKIVEDEIQLDYNTRLVIAQESGSSPTRGRVVLHITIGPEGGKPLEVTSEADPQFDKGLAKSLEKYTRLQNFPKPPGDSPIQINYPIVLEPKPKEPKDEHTETG